MTPDHKSTLEKYTELNQISFGNFGLKDLKNFPKLPKLEILELHQNKLTGSDFSVLKENCPNLRKLRLGENSITDLSVLSALVAV